MLRGSSREDITLENRIKYLEMIQGIVVRMASNSFSLKGWAVTLVAGIFALSGKDTDKMYFLVAYLPILVFWGLDSYYLLQERLYRALYDKVRQLPVDENSFSMVASTEEFKNAKNSFSACILSVTELWFYVPLAIVSTGIIILTHIL